MPTLLCCYLGDVSDERFMKKANTSDITQYTLIFTKTGIPCMYSAGFVGFAVGSLSNPLVWIIFWFILAAGALVGFSLLGQTVWKVIFSFFWPRFTYLTTNSSIPTKCTRKLVCFPHSLCSYTSALTPVCPSSSFPPNLSTLRNFTWFLLRSLFLSCAPPLSSVSPSASVYVLVWLMEYQVKTRLAFGASRMSMGSRALKVSAQNLNWTPH
jgi:hypothetical protein